MACQSGEDVNSLYRLGAAFDGYSSNFRDGALSGSFPALRRVQRTCLRSCGRLQQARRTALLWESVI